MHYELQDSLHFLTLTLFHWEREGRKSTVCLISVSSPAPPLWSFSDPSVVRSPSSEISWVSCSHTSMFPPSHIPACSHGSLQHTPQIPGAIAPAGSVSSGLRFSCSSAPAPTGSSAQAASHRRLGHHRSILTKHSSDQPTKHWPLSLLLFFTSHDTKSRNTITKDKKYSVKMI